ncbi:efflux RND transporter permease subunit [Tichowtungia aerotolerans]|uniref:MMPL family transporter n=1 Tax=Tichowtungia aerotolerans TaxID=2697043 RepID=A0A6P1MBH9_9BACT|nr:MMPL family transporter [Tichowtungia aerotolerans]QHI69448.1 MMPL family transporter [Tichowtungia aerotolerans]
MKLKLTHFSLRFPWIVVLLVLAAVIFGTEQFPKVQFDNDPENMLSPDEPVRVFHNRTKEKYALYDFVIAGIVNTNNPDGVFNVETLGRIHTLTKQLLSLRQNADGLPEITVPETFVPDLQPASAGKRILEKVFRHDVNHLFDEDGNSAIIKPELISPPVVDNIKQADQGSLKIEYLMEEPPTTREEALVIRDDAMNNPLYKGTLVSEDGKAVALYIPIVAKTYSYNVANLVEKLTADWPVEDQVYITGQPVAQDTFGIEMLVQMASSAPLAGLVIFLLLLLFFRRLSLIIAPMLVAIVSVICTMGLLIGLGFDVHIMSSMIAIFLMPIAVADSVHILSEFFDAYHRFRDKKETVKHVIGHLFMPMLYTSLTTIAGFASLIFTPIPPVKVFGAHVAFGVALAWVLTMTFVPAYIMLFVPKKMLDALPDKEEHHTRRGLDGLLEKTGTFSYNHWKLILVLSSLVVIISAIGIQRIQVNDNPVKWFTKTHRIRVADAVLNHHFGGTYTAYLTFTPKTSDACTCTEALVKMRAAAQERFTEKLPEQTRQFTALLDLQHAKYSNVSSCNPDECFVTLINEAQKIDDAVSGPWMKLADDINYMEPAALENTTVFFQILEVGSTDRPAISQALETLKGGGSASLEGLSGEDLREAALEVTDEYTALSFVDFLYEQKAEITAPPMKQPDMLRWIAKLQDHLEAFPKIGKTSSAVDALKKASYELQYIDPSSVPADLKDAIDQKNDANYSVPDTAAACGQVFIQLEGMKKKDSLFHLVTRDYQDANIWVQLTSGDNTDMSAVTEEAADWIAANPPPVPMSVEWAGLTYLNVVWQDRMVTGMLSALGSSFIVVLIMMMVLFRSPLFGLLAMIPLSVTITFIYGLLGWVGKDYDMPVAVLSSLTLGLSVDFAIHFLERARELQKKFGSWQEAIKEMFKEPAMAISRNAITISLGFTPLLFAPLTPYRTVGFFLATIMAVSWLATLFILAALATGLKKYLFRKTTNEHE